MRMHCEELKGDLIMSFTRLRTTYMMTLAIAMGLAMGSAQLRAERSVQAGKNTDVGGSFVCDCTNTENSCSCINAA